MTGRVTLSDARHRAAGSVLRPARGRSSRSCPARRGVAEHESAGQRMERGARGRRGTNLSRARMSGQPLRQLAVTPGLLQDVRHRRVAWSRRSSPKIAPVPFPWRSSISASSIEHFPRHRSNRASHQPQPRDSVPQWVTIVGVMPNLYAFDQARWSAQPMAGRGDHGVPSGCA